MLRNPEKIRVQCDPRLRTPTFWVEFKGDVPGPHDPILLAIAGPDDRHVCWASAGIYEPIGTVVAKLLSWHSSPAKTRQLIIKYRQLKDLIFCRRYHISRFITSQNQ